MPLLYHSERLMLQFLFEIALYRLESTITSVGIVLLMHLFVHTSTITSEDKGIMKSATACFITKSDAKCYAYAHKIAGHGQQYTIMYKL